MARKNSELEIERAEGFVERERQIQRLGLGALTLFVVLGAVGLFGDGPLSQAQSISGDLSVTYERFTRQSVAHLLIVEASTGQTPDARIGFDKEFLSHYSIEETRPLQVQSQDTGDQTVFVVPATNGMSRLELRLEASRPGVFKSRVSILGGASIEIRQVVFF